MVGRGLLSYSVEALVQGLLLLLLGKNNPRHMICGRLSVVRCFRPRSFVDPQCRTLFVYHTFHFLEDWSYPSS